MPADALTAHGKICAIYAAYALVRTRLKGWNIISQQQCLRKLKFQYKHQRTMMLFKIHIKLSNFILDFFDLLFQFRNPTVKQIKCRTYKSVQANPNDAVF